MKSIKVDVPMHKIPLFFESVKFKETIFALPFAYIGMLLASEGLPKSDKFMWITLAMIGARTFGMTINRIVDRHIDALNPRTKSRHLPTGTLKLMDMYLLSSLSILLLLFSSYNLNRLAFLLCPLVVVYLAIYPFTKRFTWTANFILGWALAIAPSAAWIGIKGNLSWEPVLLSLAVALWAGSFDVIYHVQDSEFYTRRNLYSVAKRFGISTAFIIARIFDVLSVCCFIALGVLMDLSFPYFIGCLLTAGILFYKYYLVSPANILNLGSSFFRVNGYVSTTMFLGTLISLII